MHVSLFRNSIATQFLGGAFALFIGWNLCQPRAVIAQDYFEIGNAAANRQVNYVTSAFAIGESNSHFANFVENQPTSDPAELPSAQDTQDSAADKVQAEPAEKESTVSELEKRLAALEKDLKK